MQPLARCTYQLGFENQLPERFRADFLESPAIVPAHGVMVSDDQKKLLYTSQMWPADTGGLLLVREGQQVGVHTRQISSLRNGCLAVLATAFKPS